jgi:hypothetical protein
MATNLIDKVIYGAIAMAILFAMLSIIVLPYFSSSYRFAQSTCWTNTTANCDYDSTVNTTVIASTQACSAGVFPAGLSGGIMCQAIVTAGGYRVINQSLMILVFFLAILGFALMFMPRKK